MVFGLYCLMRAGRVALVCRSSKARRTLPPLVGFETDQEIVVAAIPCVGLIQALSLRELWSSRLVEHPADDSRQADEAASFA